MCRVIQTCLKDMLFTAPNVYCTVHMYLAYSSIIPKHEIEKPLPQMDAHPVYYLVQEHIYRGHSHQLKGFPSSEY